MSKSGKKYQAIANQIPSTKVLSVKDALTKVKEFAYAKFDESVDVDVVLGIDATKGEHAVRGSVILPHGRGKKARVIVFAKGEHAEQARAAGADFVGAQDLVEKIQSGWLDFEYAVATPDIMGVVGQLAKILGPSGKLPNKKLGTVTFDVAGIVTDLKKGRVFFKNDKQGLVHFTIGKVSFGIDQLQDNFSAFIKSLAQAKPGGAKGKFLKKVSLTSTMGVGIRVNAEDGATL